jgi:hypothetical protein
MKIEERPTTKLTASDIKRARGLALKTDIRAGHDTVKR